MGDSGRTPAVLSFGQPHRPRPCASPRPSPSTSRRSRCRWDAVLVFCALGTVAFFYNFVALAFIQATSALAIMIAGNFKHVLLILMPLVLYDHDPSHALGWTHMIGISIFFISLFCVTAIDVYNVWHKAEPDPTKGGGAGAPPNEATPLNRGSDEARGEPRRPRDDAEANAGCLQGLPCVPPRTIVQS